MALIAVGVFFPVYLGVGGDPSVDRKLIEVGRVFRLSRLALAPPHPAAGGAARADRPALGARPWLHVRGRGRADGGVRGARLPARRRPADGQSPTRSSPAIIAFALLGKAADGWSWRRPRLRWQDTARGEAVMLTSNASPNLCGRHPRSPNRARGARRDPGPDRRIRMRQDHAPAPDRGARPGERRPIRLDGEPIGSPIRRSGSSSRSRACCPG